MSEPRGAHGPFVLAVCSEMVFRDLPIADRVRRLTGLDVQVEIWDWTKHDIDELVALRGEGAVYSSMTGYIRGGLVEPNAVADLLATAKESISVAKRLGVPRLNLHGTDLDGEGLPVAPVEVVTGPCGSLRATRSPGSPSSARHTASRSCWRTSMSRWTTPASRLLVRRTVWPWSSRLATRICGSCSTFTMRRSARETSSNVPTGPAVHRRGPGGRRPWTLRAGHGRTGYPAVAKALADMGYRGTVGLEAWASRDPTLAVERFRAAFTIG